VRATVWVLAGMFWVAAAVHAEVYRWTDASGTVHYSDRIEDVPAGFRHQIEVRGLGATRAGEQSTPQARPAPPAGAPGVPELDLDALAHAATGESDARSVDATAALAALGAIGGLGIAASLLGGFLILLVSALLYAGFILLACRVLGYERPGFGRALAIASAQTAAYLLVSIAAFLLFGFSLQDPASLQRAQGASWLLGFLSQVALFWALWCESVSKALVLTIVVTLLAIAAALVLGLVGALLFGGVALLGAASS